MPHQPYRAMPLLTSKPIINLLVYAHEKKVKIEIFYYKFFFQSNCIFHKTFEWKQSYKILDKFENIIFMWSTLGYEAIARKKKVAIFSPNRVKGFKYYFGWPATYKKSYNFFSSKNSTYSEVNRVLVNINKCSQVTWQKKYYKVIKDLFFLDKNNSKLKKVISKLL